MHVFILNVVGLYIGWEYSSLHLVFDSALHRWAINLHTSINF